MALSNEDTDSSESEPELDRCQYCEQLICICSDFDDRDYDSASEMQAEYDLRNPPLEDFHLNGG